MLRAVCRQPKSQDIINKMTQHERLAFGKQTEREGRHTEKGKGPDLELKWRLVMVYLERCCMR